MRRQALMFFAAALAFGAAHAQDSGLAGVTMRVLDDISGLDAALLELDAKPANAGKAQADGAAAAAAADRAAAPGDRLPERDERDEARRTDHVE